MTAHPIQNYRVRGWFALEGDKTFRMDYDLNENSIVLDVGGYMGDFAHALYERYRCNVYIFEPHPDFAKGIKERFVGNPKIKVFAYGLGGKDSTEKFGSSGDATSSYRENDDSASVVAKVRSVAAVLRELRLVDIDLMKINVEGAEYDIIEALDAARMIPSVRDYQVQFHDFIPDAAARLRRSRQILQSTHSPTYMFSFVWENWTRKTKVDINKLSQTMFLTVDQVRETLSQREGEIDGLKAQLSELANIVADLQRRLEAPGGGKEADQPAI